MTFKEKIDLLSLEGSFSEYQGQGYRDFREGMASLRGRFKKDSTFLTPMQTIETRKSVNYSIPQRCPEPWQNAVFWEAVDSHRKKKIKLASWWLGKKGRGWKNLLSFLSYITLDHLPRVAPPTETWALPHQSLIKKECPQTSLHANLMDPAS